MITQDCCHQIRKRPTIPPALSKDKVYKTRNHQEDTSEPELEIYKKKQLQVQQHTEHGRKSKIEQKNQQKNTKMDHRHCVYGQDFTEQPTTIQNSRTKTTQ